MEYIEIGPTGLDRRQQRRQRRRVGRLQRQNNLSAINRVRGAR